MTKLFAIIQFPLAIYAPEDLATDKEGHSLSSDHEWPCFQSNPPLLFQFPVA